MRYEPLRRYLAQAETEEVTLSFEEIETLIGRQLPYSAKEAHWRQWWANAEANAQSKAWLSVGWRAQPNREAGRVLFRRVGSVASSATGEARGEGRRNEEALSLSLERLLPSALRMIDDVAEEIDGDRASAVVKLLNDAAMARRRQILEWFAQNMPKGTSNSVDLIREDRDAR